MFFMCFFEAPSSNVPVNRLVKWVVLTSPLAWDHVIHFLKISIFFLIIHTKIQTSISTLGSLTVLLESGRGSRAFTCSVRRFLSSVFKIQLFPSRHSSDSHYSLEMATLSPATAPKCGAIKRVFLTPNYLTLIVNPGTTFYFKSVLCLRWLFT